MRYAMTSKGEPSCPVCAACGEETITRDARLDDAAVSVDDGCTQPLMGVPCPLCADELAAQAEDAQDDLCDRANAFTAVRS